MLLITMKTGRKQSAQTYRKQILWITAGLSLIALLLSRIFFANEWIIPVCISAAYTLVMSWTMSFWREHTESTQSGNKVVSSLAGMTIRLLVAATTVGIGLLAWRENREQAISFVIIFAVYYLVTLLYDTYYTTVQTHRQNHIRDNSL